MTYTVQAICMKTGRVLRERTADSFPDAIELSKNERKIFDWFDEKLARGFNVPVNMVIQTK